MEEKIRNLFLLLSELENKITSLPPQEKEYQKLVREYSRLKEIVPLAQKYILLIEEEKSTSPLLREENQEIVRMAREELAGIASRKTALEKDLKAFFLRGKIDERDIIVEIRAGTGGDEAAIFAGDLYRMYTKFAENKGLKPEILSSHPSSLKGYKEIIFTLSGKGAWYSFYFEGGIHRVQRVPVTEAGGRIHTSAASVAVLPEPKEVEIQINPDDLKIDTYRSSGAGGQHVNKTESAIRILHIPTGLVVTCQDERSQIQNRVKAMKILKARLLHHRQEQEDRKRASQRKNQVGSGDRSEKIRTYNFPQNRVTDHRINYSIYNLEAFMEGNLDDMIQKLWDREETLSGI